MTHFEMFLDERTENNASVSISEIDAFIDDLNAKEKLRFFKNLRRHLKKLMNTEYPSIDAKELADHAYEELINHASEQIETLGDRLDTDTEKIDDEKIPGQLLSRDEIIFIAHYMRKMKGLKDISNKKLAHYFSALTGHSEQNIRINLSQSGIESILPQVDIDKISDFFQQMIDMGRKDKEEEKNRKL
jgi:hypothetical protein